MVVNAPFLYGPLLLFLGGARKRSPFGKALDASAVLGLAALSVAPHQEPRFLLPTACAVFARAAPRVARLKWKRKFYVFWLVFHLAVAGFYTTIHQAGLVPLLRRVGAAHGVLVVGDQLLLPLLRRRADAGDAAAGRHRAVGPRQGRRRDEDGHALPLGPLRPCVAAPLQALAPLGPPLHGV